MIHPFFNFFAFIVYCSIDVVATISRFLEVQVVGVSCHLDISKIGSCCIKIVNEIRCVNYFPSFLLIIFPILLIIFPIFILIIFPSFILIIFPIFILIIFPSFTHNSQCVANVVSHCFILIISPLFIHNFFQP